MTRTITIILLFAACLAQAQSNSLPLEGYYHPGRYMPVRIGGSSNVTIKGADAITTESPDAGVAAVLPVLVLRPGTSPLTIASSGSTDSYRLRPLSDGQQLVGYTTSRQPELLRLYPAASSIIPIRISLENSPAAAWNTLDLLLLDPATFQRLHPSFLTELLAGGIAVAVEQTALPDNDHPWQRIDNFWIVHPPAAGPRSAMNDHGYEPTLAWHPSWPARVRFQIVAASILLVAVVIILLLMRGRWTTPVAIAALILATLFAAAWHNRTPPVFQAAGMVVVKGAASPQPSPGESGNMQQLDLWLYQTAGRDIDSALPFTDFTLPMLYSPDQAKQLDLRLICRRDGSPIAFAFHLPTNQRICFMRRTISASAPIQNPKSKIQNPKISQLAHLYQRPGDRIEPISPPLPIPGAEDFGTILISRPAAQRPTTSSVPRTTAP